MTIGDMRWEIFWRVCGWGVVAGLICGAIYGTILAPLIGTIFGAMIGAGMGLVLGLLNGLYLSSVTANLYFPLVDFEKYRQTTSVQAALISGLGVAIIMAFLVFGSRTQPVDTQVPGLLAACVIGPALIAGVAAVLMNRRVARWYKMNVDRIQSRPELKDERA